MVNKYNLVWNLDQYIRIIVVVVVVVVVVEGKHMDHILEDKHMDRIAEESE
jgi:hypothetical protein